MLRAVPNAGTWDGEPHLAAPAAPRSSLRAPAEPFVLSLSSFSPFKALRLHSTQTTSWPRPRFCLSSALSPCQTPTHRVCNSTSVQLRAGLTGGSGDAPNPPPPPQPDLGRALSGALSCTSLPVSPHSRHCQTLLGCGFTQTKRHCDNSAPVCNPRAATVQSDPAAPLHGLTLGCAKIPTCGYGKNIPEHPVVLLHPSLRMHRAGMGPGQPQGPSVCTP